MPRNKLEVTVVPRVELDQRAREARLRLERAERLFAPQPAVTYSWPRWLICSPNVSIFGDAPRKSRTRKPLSDQRPSRVYSAPMFCTKKVAGFRSPRFRASVRRLWVGLQSLPICAAKSP
jgi:hypothetical protein